MNINARNVAESLIAASLLAISASAGASVIEEITVTANPNHAPALLERSQREQIAADLDLDESQRAEIRTILKEARPELDALRKLRRSNQKAILALELSANSDVVALERLTSERGELFADTDDTYDRIRAEVGTVLAPPQQVELTDLFIDAPAPLLESSAVQFGTEASDAD